VLGAGGRQFLESRIPKEVAIVDAVSGGSGSRPICNLQTVPRRRPSAPASKESADSKDTKPQLGDRVLVTVVGEDVSRQALVTSVIPGKDPKVDPQTYTVLYLDETEETDVLEDRCTLIIPQDPPATEEVGPDVRIPKTSKQIKNIVEAATTDPKVLIEHTNPITRIMDIARLPSGKIKEVSSEKLGQADALNIAQVEFNPVPADFVQQLMMTVGAVSSFAGVPRLRNFSQLVACKALEDLAAGCTVHSAHFFEQYGANSGIRANGSHDSFDGLNGRLETLCRPVLAVIDLLADLQVLQVREIRSGCSRENCYCRDKPQRSFTAFDPDMPALRAAVRFFHPGWDAIKRCQDRYERFRPRKSSKDVRKSSMDFEIFGDGETFVESTRSGTPMSSMSSSSRGSRPGTPMSSMSSSSRDNSRGSFELPKINAQSRSASSSRCTRSASDLAASLRKISRNRSSSDLSQW